MVRQEREMGMPRSYLRWGPPGSAQRIREQVAKARKFKKGEEVLAGGQKGRIVEITDSGGIRVRVGGGAPKQYHPDHIQKLNA